MVKLIGVLGRAGAGKDTIAERLVTHHGFARVAFGDLIKRVCREIFGFTDDQLWGSMEDEARPDFRYERADGTFLTPREAMQILGTEFGRRCYPPIWIEHALKTANRLLDGGMVYFKDVGLRSALPRDPIPTGVVFSDCRFVNEVDAIQKADGKVIKVVRIDGRGNVAGIPNHASEREIDAIEPDHTIYNNDTIAQLNTNVDRIVATWGTP
jgi:hypothetical protein